MSHINQYYWIWYYANNESCISVYGDMIYKHEIPPPNPYKPDKNRSSDLPKIKEDDVNYIESEAVKGYHAAQRFVFKGLRDDDKVYKTIIMWNGYGIWDKGKSHKNQEKQGATIYLWNWSYEKGKYDKKWKLIVHVVNFGLI